MIKAIQVTQMTERFLILYLILLLYPLVSSFPEAHSQSLDVAIQGNGLSIGDSRRVNGVRLNFRDRNLERINGINITLWQPHSPARGKINGVAIGLPLTGGQHIRGVGIGAAGISAENTLSGIMIGGLGIGAGEDVTGIGIGGLGAGTGGNIKGIMVGGLGVGAGENATGIMVGGLGAGAGGEIKGILVGGLGIGAGEKLQGIGIGGLGAGSGGDVLGIFIGGIGVGAGENLTGLAIGGVGVGAGGALRGIGIGGIAVGASKVHGILVSGLAAGGGEVNGISVAPAYFTIDEAGSFSGISLSAFNHIKGKQNGVTIGLFNFAESLHGIQIGILNFARSNKKGLRWLPLFNARFD